MLRYIIKRLLALIPIILIMSMIVFGLTELASGDPARILAEMTYEHPTNEQVEWARHEYGLDQPIYKQYINWAGKAYMEILDFLIIQGDQHWKKSG